MEIFIRNEPLFPFLAEIVRLSVPIQTPLHIFILKMLRNFLRRTLATPISRLPGKRETVDPVGKVSGGIPIVTLCMILACPFLW
jgi:hypothetical protein